MSKLQVQMILEILGKPAEHIKEALNTILTKLDSEKGVKVVNKACHDPIIAEGSKDMYTSFAEVELELDSLMNYFGIMFAYMPSNIEIINPEKIPLSNFDLNDIGNKLVSRLHEYDAITKKALFEREFAMQKLNEVAPHLFKQENSQNTSESKKISKKNQSKNSKTFKSEHLNK